MGPIDSDAVAFGRLIGKERVAFRQNYGLQRAERRAQPSQAGKKRAQGSGTAGRGAPPQIGPRERYSHRHGNTRYSGRRYLGILQRNGKTMKRRIDTAIVLFDVTYADGRGSSRRKARKKRMDLLQQISHRLTAKAGVFEGRDAECARHGA